MYANDDVVNVSYLKIHLASTSAKEAGGKIRLVISYF